MDRKVLSFLVSAIFLYLAGVMTGAYLGSMTAFDITAPLQWKTQQLEKKVSSLEDDFSRAVSYLTLLVLSEDKNTTCKVLSKSMGPLINEIAEMVKLLPPRLETASIPPYLLERYSSLNVRAYLTADYLFRNCGWDRVPVLYVYRQGDVNTGYEVDRIREEFNVIVFVSSYDTNDPVISSLGGEPPFLLLCGEVTTVDRAPEVIDKCSRRYS